jgi:4-azaleucine resistance transporter AzlC
VFNQSYWILGSVLGSLLGSLLTFDTAGIEFSMTALFVTVFVEQWLTTRNHWPALVGMGCSAVCLAIFGADSFLIPTMIAVTAALLLLEKSEKEETHG